MLAFVGCFSLLLASAGPSVILTYVWPVQGWCVAGTDIERSRHCFSHQPETLAHCYLSPHLLLKAVFSTQIFLEQYGK